MYQVSLFNGNTETIIHYPTADSSAPHLDRLNLTEGLSSIGSLSFYLYPNNPGYNMLNELSTKIKIYDVRDNTIRFTGRVLSVGENMASDGTFYKEVLCESALAFLVDSSQRDNTFTCTDPTEFLTQILAIHNNKMELSKNIQVGNVDVVGSVAYTCEFKTTLATILAVNDTLDTDGNIRIRESNGTFYLDWLQSFNENTVYVTLGQNMASMVKSKDTTSFGTHIVPLGANNLTISSVNGGVDYIEYGVGVNTYGRIEKIVQYSDITDPTELYNACVADLSDYTQPTLTLETNALDLSYLTGVKAEQFALGANIYITNPVMGIYDTYNIVKMELDLLKPYNPKLTIANTPVTLTSQIVNLTNTTVKNNGVYNNVQIGSSYGIRAVRSDGKVTTTINATEGISIENDSKKVFSIDEYGDIVANDGTYNNIVANNMKAEGGTFNDIKTNNVVAKNGIYTDVTVNGAFSTGNSGEERTVIDGNGITSYDANNNMAGLWCNDPSSTGQRFSDLTLYVDGSMLFQIYNQIGGILMKCYGHDFLSYSDSTNKTTAIGTWYYKNYELANKNDIADLQSQIDALKGI